MKRSRCVPALCHLAFVPAACADSRDVGPDEAFRVTDSAGVVVAESSRPAWGDGGGWTVATEPELSIGAGATGGDDPDNPAFGSIRGVQVLSDGRIAVGDGRVDQVFVFDAAGRFSHGFGGEGEGPGEVDNLGGLAQCAGDTLITMGSYRRNFFDSGGDFVRSVSFGGSGDRFMAWPLVSLDCLKFLVSDQVPNPVGDEGLRQIYLAWSDDTFAAWDTVTRVVSGQSRRMSNPDGHVSYMPIPWTTTMPRPVASEDLTLGYGRRAELRSFGPDGHLKRITRWHAPPQPITAADRRRFEDEVAACKARFRASPQVEGLCRTLEDFTWLPPHKFFFDKLVLDPDGSIWARAIDPTSLGSIDSNHRGERRGPERWTVLAPSGEWLGTVQMPDGLALEQVANGRVYGVHRDELGLARVRVHRIEEGGPPAHLSGLSSTRPGLSASRP